MPPLLQAPAGSTGPAAPPTASLGAESDGDSKMREAVKLIEMALPRFQPGSDKYKAALDCLNKVTKTFPASAEVPGVQDTQLLQLAQRAKQSAMMRAAQAQQAAGGGGGGGGAPNPAMAGGGGMPPGMA